MILTGRFIQIITIVSSVRNRKPKTVMSFGDPYLLLIQSQCPKTLRSWTLSWKKLCHPGVSVLWKRNPEVLMYENCFAQAVMELKCSCPLLLDVLAVCLGHYVCDENKVTMIGTIYGMILHARNKQISAVQRIYTALAIQCHADNKVLFIFYFAFRLCFYCLVF